MIRKIIEFNLVKGKEPEGMRRQQPSHPLLDPRDTKSPERLIEPERENIYHELHEHEERLDALELWKGDVEKAKSIPVTLDGPGGFSLTGNWRFVASIAVLAASVLVLYIVMRYGK